MFEPQSELSSDLEWMLESGQVDRDQLAEALVQEHSDELYRSALLYLRDPGFARQAVEGAIGAALVNVYRYRHGLGVKTWLYRFLVAEWRKLKPAQPDQVVNEWTPVDRQKPRLRELGVLVYAAGFSLAEAAKVLGETEAATQRRIKKLHLNLLLNHGLSAADSGEAPDALDRRLRTAAHAELYQWNDPSPDAGSLISTALAIAERRGGRRSGWLRIQEAGLVAVFVALAAMLIWGGNGLLAADQEEHAFQLTQTAAEAALAASSRPTPDYNAGDDRSSEANRFRRAIPDPEPEPPLSLASDSGEIHRRLTGAFNFRRSIWLDASVRLYHPQAPIGFPSEFRVQFWHDRRSDRFLILSGPISAPIQEIYYSLYGQPFQFLRSEAGSYELFEIPDGIVRQGYYLIFQTLLARMVSYDEGDRYIPKEMTQFLDRTTLVVDRINLAGSRVATLWLDVNTGFAIRQHYYHLDDQTPAVEIDVQSLSFLYRLPAQVFRLDYPWNGAYPSSADFDFETEVNGTLSPEGRTEFLPPPPGYHAGDQLLHFEFASIYSPPNNSDPSLGFRTKIFTNEYYLGEIDFANPWQTICTRSPDGNRMAFVDKNRNSDQIYWFSLDELELQAYDTKGEVTQLAFSPDGQRLTYFSSHLPQGDLHILNLEQGTQRTLFSMADVRSLVWSPDGLSLGFIGRRATNGNDDRVMVINVESGYMFFENSVDFNPERSGEWPPLLWGVDFPVEMGDLRTCAQPPAVR